jgi:hypothetical protein
MTNTLPEMTPPEINSGALREPIPSDLLGSAELDKTGAFEAGSYQSFTLTYTAGRFGIDDSGSIRVAFRFATDQSDPQFDDPAAPNYTRVTASNNAVLQCRFDPKGNIRPWDRTLQVKIVKGFMQEGDTITAEFGVTDQGSPGMRLQTFCEKRYEFRVLADPIATYNFQPLAVQPAIAIVPGPVATWAAVLPSMLVTGSPFALKIKAEDRWGNPTNLADETVQLRTNGEVTGLPRSLRIKPGEFATSMTALLTDSTGLLTIRVENENGDLLATSNPAQVCSEAPSRYKYWGDIHGQSDETLGTNSAADYFAFGRDRAFLDICAHQGNDFQMTEPFWQDLNTVTAHFNEPHRFVTLPGYEWSGNTALGGDRNVFFPHEGRTMRRSSHALIEDQSDIDTDCHTAAALFEAFARHEEWDVLCMAHCGGRYADITMAHDGRFEKSVEVHSAWGTFEWLVQDAFKMGYRVGIVGNSDGHKGRPGASYPGAGWFGAIGGLTCYLMPELTREALIDCINHRHHYATSGGPNGRPLLELTLSFDKPATCYQRDPAIYETSEGKPCTAAMMGDIVHLPDGDVTLEFSVTAGSPVKRIDLFNGLEHIECYRPFDNESVGNRIAVMWEGAEYRGRFRAVTWDGTATFDNARIKQCEPVNFFNRDKTLQKTSASELQWQSVTTGNHAGFIVTLDQSEQGRIELHTPLIQQSVALQDIGYEDIVLDASGELPRRITLTRLPDQNKHTHCTLKRKLTLRAGRDNPVYVRVTLEDGTQAWTSPVYLFR